MHFFGQIIPTLPFEAFYHFKVKEIIARKVNTIVVMFLRMFILQHKYIIRFQLQNLLHQVTNAYCSTRRGLMK